MNIDTGKLKNIEKAKLTAKAFSDSILLSSFLSIINNIIEIGSKMNKIEMAMFTNSMQYWIQGRDKKKSSKKCSPGTIVEVEFGLSYKTETPYRHSALVIKEYQNKILVIPSTSRKEFLEIAFHPIDNPGGDKDFRKVGKSDNFDHDCVLVLNDFKMISKNRIISTCGQVNMDSDDCLCNEVRQALLNNVFEEEIQAYKDEIVNLNNTIESYKQTVYDKKNIINALYKKIEYKDKYIKKLKNKKRD